MVIGLWFPRNLNMKPSTSFCCSNLIPSPNHLLPTTCYLLPKRLSSIVFHLTTIILILGNASMHAQTTEWLTWRGPSANGSISGANFDPTMISDSTNTLWQTNVGMGHSAVAVQGNRLYTMGNRERSDQQFEDQVVCLDTRTGKILWQSTYPMKEGEDPGPFSTPVLDDGKLYTISRGGLLSCFDAQTGTVIWQKNLIKEGLYPENDQIACSPVIMGNRLILNMNAKGLALDKNSGAVLWNSALTENAISTACRIHHQGKELALIQTNTECFAIDPASGNLQWKVPDGYIPDPLILGDKLMLFHYKGISLYDLSTHRPKLIWKNPELKARFQSFVAQDGYVYGFIESAGVKLVCFDQETGTIQWIHKIAGGSLIEVDGILVIVDKKGFLHIAKASPDQYEEIAGREVLNLPSTDTKGRKYRRESACWTNPVLCDDKLYIRNTYGDLVCLQVGQ